MLLSQLRVLLTELLYPPRCEACHRPGTYFCADCLTAIAPFPAPRCPRCDMPLASDTADCARCRRHDIPTLNGLRVCGNYTSPLQNAIHALKYNRFRDIAVPLSTLLAEAWQTRGVAVDGLIPVPLHSERLHARGFNQAELLAHTMAHTLAVPLYTDYMVRTRPTRPQVGLQRDARLQNVQGAFEATEAVRGGRWLLVDDVCTSGATLEGCATALRQQGAKLVWAITLARPFSDSADS